MQNGDEVDAEDSKHDNHDTPNATPVNALCHDQSTSTRDTSTDQDDGHTSQHDGQDAPDENTASERPAKKRKLDPTRSRPPSPPWKKVAVDGPTSFVVNGQRKSSRTNTLPPNLRPDGGKRQVRTAAAGNRPTATRGRPKGSSLQNGTHVKTNGVTASKSDKQQRPGRKAADQSQFKTPAAKMLRKANASEEVLSKSLSKNDCPTGTIDSAHPRSRKDLKSSPVTYSKRRSGRKSDASVMEQEVDKPRGRRSTLESADLAARNPYQRLRLTFRRPTIPKRYPKHYPPPKTYSSFEEWLQHDDSLEGEVGTRLDDEGVREEARIRLKILEEAKPGGRLSRERCSVYQPDEFEEPPVYGHWDHVVAHAAHFSKLVKRERTHHIALARRVATECRVHLMTEPKVWKQYFERNKLMDQDEREALQAGYQKQRYKQLVTDLEQRWDLVRAEVNRMRLAKWEEEQQEKGKQALDEMLDQSTMLLNQRRHRRSSDLLSDEDDENDDHEDDDNDGTRLDDEDDGDDEARSRRPDSDAEGSEPQSCDPDNMSTEESEDEEGAMDEDAGLSKEALLEKYAQALQAPPVSSAASEASEDDVDDRESKSVSHGLEALVNGKHHEDQDSDNGAAGEEAESESTYNGIDPATVQLDEVDPLMLDDSDESMEDSEDDSGSSEDAASLVDGEEEGSENDQGEEDEEDEGLWSFFSKKQRKAIKEESPDAVVNGHVEAGDASTGDTASFKPLRRDNPYDVDKAKPVNGVAEKEMATLVDSQDGVRKDDQVEDDAQQESAISDDENMDVDQKSPSTAVQAPKPVEVEVPSLLLRGTLREYQHHGLDWLAGLYAGDTNGILADEMGLGKTIQTIALLAHLAVHHEVWGPHLVVVPTSVMLNWEMEFKKWCPGFKILTYYGTQEERKRKRQGWLNDSRWNVVITSYQLILQDAQAFKKRGWHYLILDEAHNIKNFQTQRWQTLLTFKTHSRLLLTGTPLQNNLSELWSLLFFLMPAGNDGHGGFAELEKFISAMRRPADQILDQGRQKLDAQAQAAVNKLHEVLRPYLLRRLKADVEKQMPAKYEHVVYCRLSKRQRQLYDGFMGRADTKRTLASGNYMSIINCLMSLRKVCNHPDLFETRQIVTSFAMPKSVVADYEIKELLVRKRLLEEDPTERLSIEALNLRLVANERTSMINAKRSQSINAIRPLNDLVARQSRRIKPTTGVAGSSVESALSNVAVEAMKAVSSQIESALHLTELRTQRKPLYGSGLVQKLTFNLQDGPIARPPQRREQLSEWCLSTSTVLAGMMPTLEQRSQALGPIIQKFGCTTPAVVASDMAPLVMAPGGVDLVHRARAAWPSDPFHEARIRLSIQFPDKRLLQYDCGKLQRLDQLLRDLQAGGHRALIFTQMTKVLDILEQFLNIHGHRYLRLDGATKIEQRQILTDRFNNDPRILCFILSSRSGGLGINLTGADTVIFYDLDWNPAMDKQCQDRCHRIGQTRDVHIYRFVSEYTIEANILRKSNQKRLLDDVIIQKGEFTTDYFKRVTYRDALDDGSVATGEDAEASAAMDRVLGDVSGLGQVLDSVEDKEDAAAAKVAQREMSHIDDADFNESTNPSATPKTSVPPTPAEPAAADEGDAVTFADAELPHVDEYMVRFVADELKDVPLAPPKERGRRRDRKGRDHRRR